MSADPLDAARDALSPLAAALAAGVRDSRTQQISLAELWRHAVTHDRSLSSAPGAGAEVAAALEELERAGLATQPRDRAQYDRRSTPALPLWLRRPARAVPARPAAPGRIWPSALEAAGRLASRPDELDVLERVASFLRAGGATRRSVPVRERSLELFGDEKRLDRLAASRLFTTGALSLSLLRCHSVAMPLAAQWVPADRTSAHTPAGPVTLLVAENHHTYESLLVATRERAAGGGPARWVGYGAGGQFRSSVASVALLDPPPARIVYFGDVDHQGLDIPASADLVSRQVGLPGVEPAGALYELLFAHGRPAPNLPLAEPAATAVVRWLGRHSAPARTLLTGGLRLAQEAVGLELLLAHPQCLDAT